jgi:hypothetical protein
MSVTQHSSVAPKFSRPPPGVRHRATVGPGGAANPGGPRVRAGSERSVLVVTSLRHEVWHTCSFSGPRVGTQDGVARDAPAKGVVVGMADEVPYRNRMPGEAGA